MIICICNNINEEKLKKIILSNPDINIRKLQEQNVCSKCKKCAPDVKNFLQCNRKIVSQ